MSRADKTFRVARYYDLVISERVEWEREDRRRLQSATRVFLATTLNHVTHNANLRRRHQSLVERRGCAVRQRRVYSEHMPAVRSSHAIVGVGNNFTMGTLATAFEGSIYTFNNQGIPSPEPAEPKDFSEARRHFLFFASGSQMQKGLDLLLEVFPRLPDLHLYVCSAFEDEPDFCVCYRRELFETPNIHPVGWVTVNSPEFARLVRTCAYMIYPSCSDGQAGAVVQSMHAGLIPLVTREAGIDTEDFGVTLTDESLDGIERLVRDVSTRPIEWHRELGVRSRNVARSRYTGGAFEMRWREIVTRIVKRRS